MNAATGASDRQRLVAPKDRAEEAYLLLQEDIVELRRLPGEQLSEVTIATHLGMSRTPVREALRRLSDKGLVVLEQGRPATVAPITTDTIAQTYQVREALETYAFRLAAQSPGHPRFEDLANRVQSLAQAEHRDPAALFEVADDVFALVSTVTGNAMLVDLIAGLFLQIRRMHGLDPNRQSRMSTAITQWVDLLQAVARGDDVEAGRLVSVRLRASMQAVTDALPRMSPRLIGPPTHVADPGT